MRMTALQFRETYDGEGMLQYFRQTLILPHIERLRRLRPLSPSWAARGPMRAIQ